LAGWCSDNKFSLLGSLRVSAQMLSYEVTMGLNLIGIFMIYQSVELNKIIVEQGDLLFGFLPKWGIFTQPVAFILFLTAAIAESKRAPFDVPEGESEIVAGYHTEFSSMRFALFFMAEFVGIVVIAAVAAALFLGGWQIPFVDPKGIAGGWIMILQVLTFVAKVVFMCWVQMMIRWSLPRFRYDQIMKLGWKYLLPLSLMNIFVTALVLLLIKS
ncbi:MAG: NADH-quinone oxidoreductase subunit H, partial [Deltaproteobacteria bacterium]|nr:NADH-quinone oxidoreductase subunit H [Deltaproteobacteria bacterium]